MATMNYFVAPAVRPDAVPCCGSPRGGKCCTRRTWASLALSLAVPLHIAATLTSFALNPQTPAFAAVRSEYAGAGANRTTAFVWSTNARLLDVQSCLLPVVPTPPYAPATDDGWGGRAAGEDVPYLGRFNCASNLTAAAAAGAGAGYLDVFGLLGVSRKRVADAAGNAAFGSSAGAVGAFAMALHGPHLPCARRLRARQLAHPGKRAGLFVATLACLIATVAASFSAVVSYEDGFLRPAGQYWTSHGADYAHAFQRRGTLPPSDPAALYTLWLLRGYGLALGAGITDTIALFLFLLYGVSCRFGACPADGRWADAAVKAANGDVMAVLAVEGAPPAGAASPGGGAGDAAAGAALPGAAAQPVYAYTADGVPVATFAVAPAYPQYAFAPGFAPGGGAPAYGGYAGTAGAYGAAGGAPGGGGYAPAAPYGAQPPFGVPQPYSAPAGGAPPAYGAPAGGAGGYAGGAPPAGAAVYAGGAPPAGAAVYAGGAPAFAAPPQAFTPFGGAARYGAQQQASAAAGGAPSAGWGAPTAGAKSLE